MQPSELVARRGPRTWVVVALTLTAVLVVALAFVVGVVTGVAISHSGGGTDRAASSPDLAGGGGSTGPTASGTLDPCLVGTWRTVEQTETSDTDQGRVSITGVDRTVRITADGTETITYGDAPATVTTEQGKGTVVFTGTVVYGVSTGDGTMRFELRSADGTVTVSANGSTPSSSPLKPGTGPVSYTCAGDRFTQDASGFRAVLDRVS